MMTCLTEQMREDDQQNGNKEDIMRGMTKKKKQQSILKSEQEMESAHRLEDISRLESYLLNEMQEIK